MKCFPSIPINGYTISNRFEKNRLVESLWKGGRDPNYKKNMMVISKVLIIVIILVKYYLMMVAVIMLILRFCQHCGEYKFIDRKKLFKTCKKL